MTSCGKPKCLYLCLEVSASVTAFCLSFPSGWQCGKVVADGTQVSLNADVRTAKYFANDSEAGKEGRKPPGHQTLSTPMARRPPSAKWCSQSPKCVFFSRNLTLSANSIWLAEGVGYDEKCFVFRYFWLSAN